MKKTIYILAGMALSSMMMSCEDIYEGGEERHPQLPVQMKAAIQPFDSDLPESWKGGEEIGMFMFASGSADGLATATCTRLKTDAEGTLQPVDSETMPLYPANATKVDFICFYPYEANSAESKSLSLDVCTKENALNSDFLYSNSAKNKYPGLAPVKVQMKHVLSMVQFNITADEDIPAEDLKALDPKIEEVPTKGLFSLADGKLSSSETSSAIPMSADAAMTKAECLLLPASSNFTVRCNVSDMVFRKKLGNMSFESGKIYKFDLHVTQPGFEISLREIEDWKVETYD